MILKAGDDFKAMQIFLNSFFHIWKKCMFFDYDSLPTF